MYKRFFANASEGEKRISPDYSPSLADMAQRLDRQ
jgi:hypothetical protein